MTINRIQKVDILPKAIFIYDCNTAHIVDFIIDRWRRYELKLNKIVKPKFRTFRSFRTQLSLSKISRKVFTIFNNGSISFVFPVTVEVNIHPQCPYFQLMLIFIRKMTSLKLSGEKSFGKTGIRCITQTYSNVYFYRKQFTKTNIFCDIFTKTYLISCMVIGFILL